MYPKFAPDPLPDDAIYLGYSAIRPDGTCECYAPFATAYDTPNIQWFFEPLAGMSKAGHAYYASGASRIEWIY